MNNTYFILSNTKLSIDRLHICTWDFLDFNAAIEIGIEFTPVTPNIKTVDFKLSLPFLKTTDKVTCLMDSLVRDDDNCKFIFNDTIKNTSHIRADKRNGSVLEFSSRNKLSVLPVKDIKTENGFCSFSVQDISHTIKNYVRIYIQTNVSELAIIRKGITKETYIYDIKVNEKRNLPSAINDLLSKGLYLCNEIKACFCFHVIPSSYNIAYLNSAKLKNIRILESDAFNRYLPNTSKISNNECIIVFNKSENSKDGSYTFFSEFEKETIGNKQIVWTIFANIMCSLLFGVFSLRSWTKGQEWYNWLPWEYWVTFICLLSLFAYLFVPWRKIFKKIKKCFK